MDSNEIFDKVLNYSSTNKKDEKEKGTKEEKKLKPSERLLLGIEKQGFNMSQLKGVLTQKGNQLIISCAGSGKTTALVFKIIYNTVTGEATRVVPINGNTIRVPDKIWVCTFLKSGAVELERKLSAWQRKLGVADTSKAIAFSTLHAEFKRALNAMGFETNIVSAADNSKYLKEVVAGYSLRNGDGRPLNSENMRDLESALAYTRNRIDGKRYDREIYEEIGIGRVIIESILIDWKKQRQDNGFVDFEDLQEKLFDLCIVKKNKDVIGFLQKRYNYIYIDEFQDTSQVQYEILKVYASGVKKIVAIGDDDQTIYSWRGSYNGIITKQFKEDFDPVISELSLNYRCPETILNSIIPSIEKNKDRFNKSLKASKKGGVLRVGGFPNYKIMVETLGDLIYKDIEEGLSVAVLCRVNSDGLMPAMILDSMGKFSFSISGEGMTLDSYIGRLILGIVRLFTDSYSQKVEQSLNMLTWDKYSVSKLLKVCKNNRVSLWSLSDEDLSYSCPDIYPVLSEWRGLRKTSGDVVTLKHVFEYYRTEVFKKDTQFNRVCKSVILSMEALLIYNNYNSVSDFLEDLESINERLKARKKSYYGNKVRIATVHEFKGKEADSVYVWNDSNRVYPNGNCSTSNPEEYEEERRVHYIACTRAKKKSTIMYLNGAPGDFVLEMDLSNAEEVVTSEGIKGVLLGALSEEDKNLKKLEKEAVIDDEDDILDFENIGSGSNFTNFKSKIKKKDEILHLEEDDESDQVIDPGDIEVIIKMYNSGMDACAIQNEFEENGYDMYGLDAIQEVIDDYLRYGRR